MARVQTLEQRVQAVIRRYKYVDKNRFVYNQKSETKGTFNKIKVWLLIHDEQRGYSIFEFNMQRRSMFTIKDWQRLFKEPHSGYKESLYTVITQSILPAINNRAGSEWVFKTLLAWTRVDDLPKRKNSATSSKRNKATKKGASNARNTNRRRHRNKKR